MPRDDFTDRVREALEGAPDEPVEEVSAGTPLEQLRQLAAGAQSESVRVQALRVLLERHDRAAERARARREEREGQEGQEEVCSACGHPVDGAVEKSEEERDKELDITSIASGATASYVAENAHLAVSELTLAQQVLLRPRELGALVPISNKLLKAAGEAPAVEQVLRAELAEVIALRADLAFLQGTGGLEPVGIRNVAGLTPGPNLGANGATPTFDDIKAVVAGLRAVNAPFQTPGWIMHPRTLSTLERLKLSTGEYLGDTGLLKLDRTGGGFELLGYPGRSTTQIPTNLVQGTSSDCSYIVFSSDWDQAWVGEGQELEIEASGDATYTTDGGTTWISAWQARQQVSRAVTSHDLGLRRPTFFTILTGIRP